MAEAVSVFHKAIAKVFNGWTAFQLAVSQGFGGIHTLEKAAWLVDAVEQWFKENDDIEPWELSDFLEDIVNTEFDTFIDDNSLLVVSKAICKYFAECKQGREAEVLADIEKIPVASLQNLVVEQHNTDEGDDEDDDDDEEEDEDPSLAHSAAAASRLQPEAMEHEPSSQQSSSYSNSRINSSEIKPDESSNSQDAEMEEEWTTVVSRKKKK